MKLSISKLEYLYILYRTWSQFTKLGNIWEQQKMHFFVATNALCVTRQNNSYHLHHMITSIKSKWFECHVYYEWNVDVTTAGWKIWHYEFSLKITIKHTTSDPFHEKCTSMFNKNISFTRKWNLNENATLEGNNVFYLLHYLHYIDFIWK